MSCLAGPFGMVNVLSSWSIWDGTKIKLSGQFLWDGKMAWPAGPFRMAQCTVWLVHMRWNNIIPAGPFWMVKCLVWPVHLGWYNILSSWFIWVCTMLIPTSPTGMVQYTVQPIHLGWYNKSVVQPVHKVLSDWSV